jgi:hypothetical protein
MQDIDKTRYYLTCGKLTSNFLSVVRSEQRERQGAKPVVSHGCNGGCGVGGAYAHQPGR